MSVLTHIEKQKLERELGMRSGYVLNFSNRTFDEFFREVVGIGIYDARYEIRGDSKANRLRTFWDAATDAQMRSLLEGLREGWDIYAETPMPASSGELIQGILRRMGGGRQTAAQPTPPPPIDEAVSKRLNDHLLTLSKLPPHERGYEFERFLKALFDAYHLAPRDSFRLRGEQIDGSFLMHQEVYLLEAKWENTKTGADDLRNFQGKVTDKAAWSRGLFVSISGFTEDGLYAFGRGKSVVCMDGLDLFETLRRKLSLVDVLTAKVRRAGDGGCPFVPVRELFD